MIDSKKQSERACEKLQALSAAQEGRKEIQQMKMFKDEVVKLSTEMYIDGNESRVLTYAGVKYYEPVFMGQSIGVVQEVLKDGKKYYCLIKSPDAGNEWLTISRADLINFRVGVPKKGTPIYFCILTKNRKRRN